MVSNTQLTMRPEPMLIMFAARLESIAEYGASRIRQEILLIVCSTFEGKFPLRSERPRTGAPIPTVVGKFLDYAAVEAQLIRSDEMLLACLALIIFKAHAWPLSAPPLLTISSSQGQGSYHSSSAEKSWRPRAAVSPKRHFSGLCLGRLSHSSLGRYVTDAGLSRPSRSAGFTWVTRQPSLLCMRVTRTCRSFGSH